MNTLLCSGDDGLANSLESSDARLRRRFHWAESVGCTGLQERSISWLLSGVRSLLSMRALESSRFHIQRGRQSQRNIDSTSIQGKSGIHGVTIAAWRCSYSETGQVPTSFPCPFVGMGGAYPHIFCPSLL